MTVTDRQPLPSVMADLVTRRATGSLLVTSGDVVREIHFTNGEIRSARSQIEDEKLGMWLVSRDKISEDDRALVLLAQGGGVAHGQRGGHSVQCRFCWFFFSCHFSGYTGPRSFTQRGPAVFTQTGPLVFTRSGP